MTYEEIISQQGFLIYTNTGVSMMPLIHPRRDLLVIKPKPEGRLHRLDVPLFKRTNGEYVVHRVLKVRKDDYGMCGDHQTFIEYGITDSQILGVVEALIRDGKTIPLRATPEHPNVSWKYKFYVHLWCDLFYLRAFILRVIFKLNRIFQKNKA